MGTTLSVVHFAGDQAYFGHVGDSRVYLFRDGGVTRLTKDHTMVEELVETGTITSEQAKTHPKKNILVKALGTQDGLDVDTGQASVNSGDIIILMTDGVYEYVEEEYLAKLLSEKTLSEVEEIIDKMICDGGAKDNYTLLMVGLN
jgi:protein phosphatase